VLTGEDIGKAAEQFQRKVELPEWDKIASATV
jgi:hypothetical protein